MARIAFITLMAGYPWGGSECLWAVTAEQALKEGHEVLLSIYDWSITHPAIYHLQSQGAVLLPRPRFPKPSQFDKVLNRLVPHLKNRISKSSFQAILNCEPDVICVNQGSTYDIAFTPDLLTLLRQYSVPYSVICQFNTDTYQPDEATRILAQKFFTYADSICFVSKHNLKLAERQLSQALPSAVVVQNPVNLVDLSPVPWLFQENCCFANVARLDSLVKGQDLLLEVLSQPEWQERNWQCNLYGSGGDQRYLANLAQHYKVIDRVNFCGQISDVRSIWESNHLLVLPSRAEGTPLALVEAMLCARPAIVTDVGGNTDWIEEGQTGFIAEGTTIRSFGAALERAWLAQSEWKQMGMNAHKFATAKFDPLPGQRLLNILLSPVKG